MCNTGPQHQQRNLVQCGTQGLNINKETWHNVEHWASTSTTKHGTMWNTGPQHQQRNKAQSQILGLNNINKQGKKSNTRTQHYWQARHKVKHWASTTSTNKAERKTLGFNNFNKQGTKTNTGLQQLQQTRYKHWAWRRSTKKHRATEELEAQEKAAQVKDKASLKAFASITQLDPLMVLLWLVQENSWI